MAAHKPLQISELDKGRRPDIEADLNDKYHVKWSYVSHVKTVEFDVDKSRHNQARFEPIDEKVVATYTDAVKRGDAFPAVLAWKPSVTSRYVVIDGNHRLAAHIRAEKPLAGVYEIDPTTDPRTVAVMTFAFNTRHGMATTEAERTQGAVYLVDNGASVETAASAVNLPVRIVKKALARNAADARADEVRMPRNEWDTLSAVVKARLWNITTDEGFADAAKLAYMAKLDTQEVFELVALLNATKSGMRQRAMVAHQSEIWRDRIQAGVGGMLSTADRRKLGPKQRVSLALAQTMALPEDDQAIVSAYALPERPAAAKRMREASLRLAHLADLLSDE